MQHDPVRIADTSSWLEKAEDSLQIANHVVSAMVERVPIEARPPGAR